VGEWGVGGVGGRGEGVGDQGEVSGSEDQHGREAGCEEGDSPGDNVVLEDDLEAGVRQQLRGREPVRGQVGGKGGVGGPEQGEGAGPRQRRHQSCCDGPLTVVHMED